MGTATGLEVCTTRDTGRGSDHYSDCELCGNRVNDTHVATRRNIYRRDNGQHYLNWGSGGTYGHIGCLIKQFGDLVAESSLKRDGNVLLIEDWAVEKIRHNV